jgi:hypothetical protein
MAEPVKTHFLWRPQLRNPGDEMVLETAVNGRADTLVTFNVRDFGTVPARFGIEVMIPRFQLCKRPSSLLTAKRADFKAFDKLMKRRGGKPPRAGDEMPGSKAKASSRLGDTP